MNSITVQVRASGMVGDQMLDLDRTAELKGEADLKRLARWLDRNASPPKRKFYWHLLKDPRATLLLNGNRVDGTDAVKTQLNDGDQVDLIIPLPGG